MEKGERIGQLIVEKIKKSELQEVTLLNDTKSGDQGVRSSDTTMDQNLNGQEATTKMEMNEISARAFG